VRSLALAFGAPVALHAPVRKGSLRAAATAHGCRVILYEAGEARRFHRRAIQVGVSGTLRVMHHLGMIDGDVPAPQAPPQVASRSSWVRARRSGLCQMRASLGDTIEAGQRIAVVIDTVGSRESLVRSRVPGVLIGHLNQAIVNRGDAIAHVAELEAPSGR
jgi:predicted deacylase